MHFSTTYRLSLFIFVTSDQRVVLFCMMLIVSCMAPLCIIFCKFASASLIPSASSSTHPLPLLHPTMAISRAPFFFFFFFFTVMFLLFFTVQATTTSQYRHPARHPFRRHPPPSRLIRASCASARYPRLCIRTLSTATAVTPAGIAQAAVSASLTRVRSSSAFLSHLRSRSRRESGALRDCVEQLSDSIDQLRRTLVELRHLQPGTFRWQMSDVETWVSAALTNEDTCLDGFQGVKGSVKVAVKKKVAKIAHMTSNALYLINRLASTRP